MLPEPEITDLLPKRAYDTVPVEFDWHDFLANQPARGKEYGSGAKVRLRRKHPRFAGVQFTCSTPGVSGADEPRWPKNVGETVVDGTCVWTAEAMAANSMRTTVSSNELVAPAGLTCADVTVEDYVYRTLAAGGVSGQDYVIVHRIVCADSGRGELAGRLPVRDYGSV